MAKAERLTKLLRTSVKIGNFIILLYYPDRIIIYIIGNGQKLATSPTIT